MNWIRAWRTDDDIQICRIITVMAWLRFGIIYTLAYVLADWLVPDGAVGKVWLRTAALSIPPALVIGAIVRRRSRWNGCQRVFWSTVAIGLVVSTVGFLGWTVDGLLAAREASSLEWHAVLALFGVVAPLLALLAQPHLGTRERAAATTAVDIAGIAVFTGFLFSYVVMGLTLTPGVTRSAPLSFLLLSELLQLLVLMGLLAAAGIARGTAWDTTYQRLALGMLVQFVARSLSNAEIWLGAYQNVALYDYTFIVPFFFYLWAVDAAPGVRDGDRVD